MFGDSIKIVKHYELYLFQAPPKYWIVERPFTWLNRSRRLSKDYERKHASTETMIHTAFVHVRLRHNSVWPSGANGGPAIQSSRNAVFSVSKVLNRHNVSFGYVYQVFHSYTFPT
jgi:hypothetical protein